jgi:hypothetical protein
MRLFGGLESIMKMQKKKSKIALNRKAIIDALYQGKVLLLPKGKLTPKWEKRWEGCPSLNDTVVSSLFRADYIEHDKEIILNDDDTIKQVIYKENIILTSTGKLIAEGIWDNY